MALERLQILPQAVVKTFRDRELIGEAEKSQLEIAPIDSDDVRQFVWVKSVADCALEGDLNSEALAVGTMRRRE